MQQSPAKGQNLSEYGLVIGLVVIVAVAALVSLGDNISAGLVGTLSSGQPAGSLNLGSQNSPAGTQSPSGQNVSLTANGQVLTLENYPVDVAEILDQTGADGVSRDLANQIASLANQLKDAKAVDEETYRDILELSNLGFRQVTAIEFFGENLKSVNGDKEAFRQTLLAKGIPAITSAPGGILYNDDFSDPDFLKPFLAGNLSADSPTLRSAKEDPNYLMLLQLQKILRSDIGRNPGVRQVLTHSTETIIRLANETVNAKTSDVIADNFRETAEKSTVICDTGNGQVVSGIRCE